MKKNILRILSVLALVILAACFPGAGASSTQDPPLKVLPALRQAGLQGRLIFIQYRQQGNRLVQLDLASGQTRALFSAPNHSWLAAAELSPDGKQILLAYGPPPSAGQIQLGSTDLYRMPADGSSAPAPLMTRKASSESYFNPIWSPDGQMIYYTHNIPSSETKSGIESDVERYSLGGSGGAQAAGTAGAQGQGQVLARHALWPRLSPDGSRVAYLTVVPNTTDNQLYTMNADGSGAAPLVTSRKYPIIDAHLFSPDGKSVYFSSVTVQSEQAVPPQPAAALNPPPGIRGIRIHFGVTPVSAHNNPEDWFQVSLDGGQVSPVAAVQNVNMMGTFSPDGQWFAFGSQSGLFVMKPDGSQRAQIASLLAMGSLNWTR